jgi:hypothetical protein
MSAFFGRRFHFLGIGDKTKRADYVTSIGGTIGWHHAV